MRHGSTAITISFISVEIGYFLLFCYRSSWEEMWTSIGLNCLRINLANLFVWPSNN